MGAFNEIYHAFETIQSKQERIYNDAADYGYAYDSKNIPDEIQIFIDVMDDLKNDSNMIISKEHYAGGVSFKIHVPIEHDDGVETGYEYNVSANLIKNINHPALIKKGSNVFISVDTKMYHKDIKTGKLL